MWRKNGQIDVVTGDAQIADGIRVMHTPAHTAGGLTVFIDAPEGTAAITGFCVIDENFNPPPEIKGMEMDVIPPGTHVNVYEAYQIMKKVQEQADILIPLHEPRFAGIPEIG